MVPVPGAGFSLLGGSGLFVQVPQPLVGGLLRDAQGAADLLPREFGSGLPNGVCLGVVRDAAERADVTELALALPALLAHVVAGAVQVVQVPLQPR